MTTAEKPVTNQDVVRAWNAITERIKNRTPECPLGDGKVGVYVRNLGWRGDALYRCPNGHEFTLRGDSVKIIKR